MEFALQGRREPAYLEGTGATEDTVSAGSSAARRLSRRLRQALLVAFHGLGDPRRPPGAARHDRVVGRKYGIEGRRDRRALLVRRLRLDVEIHPLRVKRAASADDEG